MFLLLKIKNKRRRRTSWSWNRLSGFVTDGKFVNNFLGEAFAFLSGDPAASVSRWGWFLGKDPAVGSFKHLEVAGGEVGIRLWPKLLSSSSKIWPSATALEDSSLVDSKSKKISRSLFLLCKIHTLNELGTKGGPRGPQIKKLHESK